MKAVKDITKMTLYQKLLSRIKREKLDYDEVKNILAGLKKLNNDISMSDFLRSNFLFCVKKQIVDINSNGLLKALYGFSFTDDRKGYLTQSEIKRIAESFYGVKIYSAVLSKIILSLKINHGVIYRQKLTSNRNYIYAFIEKDELEIMMLFGDLDKKLFNYYKKIVRK